MNLPSREMVKSGTIRIASALRDSYPITKKIRMQLIYTDLTGNGFNLVKYWYRTGILYFRDTKHVHKRIVS